VISIIDDKTPLINFIDKAGFDIPKVSDSPNDKQKGLIYLEGAAPVYYIINKEKTYVFKADDFDQKVYSSILEAAVSYDEFSNSGGMGLFLNSFYVLGYREISTLNNIIEKAASYNFSDCALIFGAAHDFKKYQTSLLKVQEIEPGDEQKTEEEHGGFGSNIFNSTKEQKDFLLKLFSEEKADDKNSKAEQNKDLYEAIIQAVYHGDKKRVKKLTAEIGSLKDVKSEDGLTPLMFAVGNCPTDFDLVKFLIDNGSDVNAVDNKGQSVLMYTEKSCSGGNRLEIVKFLIEEKNVYIKDMDELIDFFKKESSAWDKKDIIKYLKSRSKASSR